LGSAGEGFMLQKIRWFLLLVGVLLIVIIALQNSRSVELELLFFRGQYPLTLLLLGCSAASFVLGALTTGWMLRNRSRSGGKPKKRSSTGSSTS
jgi:uncharacterized integral membrane protein